MAYSQLVIFIETKAFTKRCAELLDDVEYAEFQQDLVADPGLGDVIEGTGGLRKVRVGAKGKGKRGGARVVYFHFVSDSQIAMLLIYPKGEKDLSSEERKALKKIVETWSKAT
jgi:hypothetical protein